MSSKNVFAGSERYVLVSIIAGSIIIPHRLSQTLGDWASSLRVYPTPWSSSHSMDVVFHFSVTIIMCGAVVIKLLIDLEWVYLFSFGLMPFFFEEELQFSIV